MTKDLFTALCQADGLSGYEQPVAAVLKRFLQNSPAEADITEDAMGNLLVHVHGKEAADKKVLFDAPMDEDGFMITSVCEDGSLRFTAVGNPDIPSVFGSRVHIGSVQGVIGTKAIHMCTGDEKTKIPAADKLVIDIGVTSAQEAEKLVRPGDKAVLEGPMEWLGNKACGKAVDSRLACAVVAALTDDMPKRDFFLSFTVRKKVGVPGAPAAARAINPDIAIVVDGYTAADTAGVSDDKVHCRLGSGVAIPFADKAAQFDAALIQQAVDAAKAHGVRFQMDNFVDEGSNGGAIQQVNSGVKVAAVGIPSRYRHSSACMAQWEDACEAAKLLKALAEELTL